MTGPRTIPQIRARLHELARERGIPELAALAEETKRRTPVRRAPRRLPNPSPDKVAEVQAMADRFPAMPMREIGQRLGLDQGRVSEILAGKRGE